jgi:hypothetical protein
MREFSLPVIDSTASVQDAFKLMIRGGVSGIVTKSGSHFRLLHYTQISAALDAGLTEIKDINGFVKLEPPPERGDDVSIGLTGDYSIVSESPHIVIRSRREPGALIYMTESPGYCCDAPAEHCYPPLRRGASDKCVIPGCPGKLP